MNRHLQDILKGVSRSFYLSIRILPPALRDPVGIAYLFCRTADTIADTDLVPVSERLQQLREFREEVLPFDKLPPNSRRASRANGQEPFVLSLSKHVTPVDGVFQDPEERLLQAMDRIFFVYHSFAPAIQKIIADLVTELTQGMEMDLKFFGENGKGAGPRVLPDAASLDRYTYYVAGVVGKFWTAILMELEPRCRGLDREQMTAWGIRYGKGLQLINILRDLPRDLRRGRCYLPADELAAAGLVPAQLMNGAPPSGFDAIYDHWWQRARGYLEDGRRYVEALPRSLFRVRKATALPLRLGFSTLDLLKNNPRVLDPRVVIKIPRWKVYASLLSLMRE